MRNSPQVIGEFCRVLRDAGIDIFESGSTLNWVPMGMYWDDKTIDELTLPEGIESIEMNAFSGSSLRKINLPDSLETIMDCAFSNCSNLKEIVLPQKSLTSLAYGLFIHTPIERVYFKGTMDEWRNVESSLFNYNTKLKTVSCLDGVVDIL